MNAHALWYLTRGTGIVALVLVTASVLIGILASLRTGGSRTRIRISWRCSRSGRTTTTSSSG